MADSAGSSQTPGAPKPPKREISTEQRLLLAFVLMGLVLLATQYLFKPPAPSIKKTEAPKPAQQAQQAKPPAPQAPFTATAQPSSQVAAQAEELVRIDTGVYKVVLSNRGANVRSWTLDKYQTQGGKPLELVNTAAVAAKKAPWPLSTAWKSYRAPVDVNNVLYAATRTADGLGVDFEYSNGQLTVRKRLRFTRSGYLSEFSSEALENGRPVPHFVSWRGGFGDASIQGTTTQQTLHFSADDRKLVTADVKAAKDGPVTAAGNFSFAGLQDQYFAAVFLPKDGATQMELQTLSDTVATPFNKEEHPHVGARVGGLGLNRFALFVGPKDYDLLRTVDPRLSQLIDFGTWFGFLAKPLFVALNWVYDNWIHNMGWAIVVVTIIINLVLTPLRIASIKSMKKMSVIQPQIAAINEKYKGVSMKDPRRQQQNEEIMALYKKHGVNPTGGCMPMLLQIPFFIAFYTVLTVAIEMRGAQWLWVQDLSQPEHLAIRVLPVLMIATQFILQKMTPATSADPMQQRMMMLMPLMMGFFFYNVSSGLVLYWLTGNIVALVQQWFFNRWYPSPAPAVVDVKPVSPKKKR